MKAVERLRKMERLFAAAEAGSARAPVEALDDPDWTVVQAALHAIRLHPRAEYAGPVARVLARQDELDIYGQTSDAKLNEVPRATKEVWKCRWRIKQAASHALGAIGAACGRTALSEDALARLRRWAADREREDYHVRAAACLALAQIRDPAARESLAMAAADDEFCTRTEARKALAVLGG